MVEHTVLHYGTGGGHSSLRPCHGMAGSNATAPICTMRLTKQVTIQAKYLDCGPCRY